MQAELAAMAKVSEALSALDDSEARRRVIAWATSAFGGQGFVPPRSAAATRTAPVPIGHSGGEKEIPGIARVTQDGELHLTVRDLKARSANDAAIRIAHLALLANERLNHSESLSSKNVLVPMLRRYRAYDGNTRSALAQHRGFARAGDQLSMDLHCKEEAEEFIRQILDPTVQGTWNPASKPTKKKRPSMQVENQEDVTGL
jgi:hypothetical protein